MSLEAEIRTIINQFGYITIDELIKVSLSMNLSSYYRSADPFGLNGDFITSPEISQMFGEMIGVWAADAWIKLGQPNSFNIVEPGPGRGLLMRDLLRATKYVKGFQEAANIELIDISERLIEIQKRNIKFERTSWHNDFEKISPAPTIFIANEFFDAMPIKQYEKFKDTWYERIVKIDPNSQILHFDRLPLSDNLQKHLQYEHLRAGDGAIVEESGESLEIIRFIIEHLKTYGGVALIIDYGYDVPLRERKASEYSPTLQAIKNHKYHPILENLGKADLSAHVNFSDFKSIAEAHSLKTFGTINQGNFLHNIGIKHRLEMLLENTNIPLQKQALLNQYTRLTSPSKMGELFKVLIITGNEDFTPAGI